MMLSAEQAQGLAMFLIQGIDQEIPTTRKILAAVPQDKLGFQLGEKGRTAQDLMWHTITADIWFAEGIAAGQFAHSESSEPAPATVNEMVSKYDAGIGAAMAKVKAMSPAQLAKPISFFNVMNLPAVMYLQFLSNHSIHHRGQLSTYLRAMNAHVPGIYGGSADEPFQAAAQA
jgi:uncharacterized damage-inducible protein DinB